MNTFGSSGNDDSIITRNERSSESFNQLQKLNKISPTSITAQPFSHVTIHPVEDQQLNVTPMVDCPSESVSTSRESAIIEENPTSWFDVLNDKFRHERLVNRKRTNDGIPERKNRQ